MWWRVWDTISKCSSMFEKSAYFFWLSFGNVKHIERVERAEWRPFSSISNRMWQREIGGNQTTIFWSVARVCLDKSGSIPLHRARFAWLLTTWHWLRFVRPCENRLLPPDPPEVSSSPALTPYCFWHWPILQFSSWIAGDEADVSISDQ